MFNPLRLRADYIVVQHLEGFVPVGEDDLLVFIAVLIDRDVVPVDTYLQPSFSQLLLGQSQFTIEPDDLRRIVERPLQVDIDQPSLQGQLVLIQRLVDQLRKELLELNVL